MRLASNRAFGLNEVISLEPGIRTIESLLQEIIESGVNLSYSDNSLPLRKYVKIKTQSRTVHQHLITIFNDEKIAYEQSENAILLYKSIKKLRKKVTIRGVVKDYSTGENLIGAHIWIDTLDIGTTTNQYGFYSISLRQGDYKINSSYLGYQQLNEVLILRKNTRLNFDLRPQTPELKEVVISSQETNYILTHQLTGQHKLDIQILGKIPYFLGEVDVTAASTTEHAPRPSRNQYAPFLLFIPRPSNHRNVFAARRANPVERPAT